MEDALEAIRARTVVSTPARVRVLLRAAGRLNSLVEHAQMSNQADIAEITAALELICPKIPAGHYDRNGARLRVLLAEDDFASRLML
jgi:hypothetical protein